MRVLLLFSFIMSAAGGALLDAAAQAPRRATQPGGRSGIAITVTDPDRATIPGVNVELTGPTTATAQTDASGQVSFPGLQAGTYRLRFSGEPVTVFEREVTLRAGQIARLDITLTPATPAADAAAQEQRAAPAVGPAGEPQVLSVVDLVERELVGSSEPRKDTLVACSGNTRSMLVQLNEAQARRVYENAEALYYVVAGEGAIAVDGREVPLEAGGYAALPRGTGHALTRSGRRPLVLLAVLSGEPCEVAK